MNIAICDDAATDRLLLAQMMRRYARQHFFEVGLAEYGDGPALLGEFRKGRFQILFLDILMGSMDGISVARQIRREDKDCIIIFSTSSPNYAVEGFTVHAAGYLLKPFRYEQLEEVLDWCGGAVQAMMRYIDVRSNRIIRRIYLKDIQYIEVCNRVCRIHTQAEIITTYRTLSEMAQAVDDPAFFRCHRSFLINMEHIDEVLDNDFIVDGGDRVPISMDDKVRIKQAYYDYCARRRLHNAYSGT